MDSELKEGDTFDEKDGQVFAWLRKLVEAQKHVKDPDEFMELYGQGLSDVRIGKELGCSESTIGRYRIGLGLPTNAKNAKSIVLIHPNGKEEKFNSSTAACRKYNLNTRCISKVLKGKQKTKKDTGPAMLPKFYKDATKTIIRQVTIIEPYKRIFGDSLPAEKQYWTLCNLQTNPAGQITEESEIGQLLDTGLITKEQFHGVDYDADIIEHNKRHIPESHWYAGDFFRTLLHNQDDFNPGIIYLDFTCLGKKAAKVSADTIELINYFKINLGDFPLQFFHHGLLIASLWAGKF